jgi:hypothetical protein
MIGEPKVEAWRGDGLTDGLGMKAMKTVVTDGWSQSQQRGSSARWSRGCRLDAWGVGARKAGSCGSNGRRRAPADSAAAALFGAGG